MHACDPMLDCARACALVCARSQELSGCSLPATDSALQVDAQQQTEQAEAAVKVSRARDATMLCAMQKCSNWPKR
eukprot:6197491-Pleurochrysis_carterae.AAC.1